MVVVVDVEVVGFVVVVEAIRRPLRWMRSRSSTSRS